MTINVGAKATLFEIINQANNLQENQIEINIDDSATGILNSANLISIKKILTRNQKSINFTSTNKSIMDYLNLINTDQIEFAIPDIDIGDDFKPAKTSSGGWFLSKIGGIFQKNKSNSVSDNSASKSDLGSTISTNSDFANYGGPKSVIGSLASKIFKFRAIYIAIILLLLIGSSAFAGMYFIPSATIDIKIKTDTLIKLIEIKSSKDYQLDVQNKLIPAIEVTATETDTLNAKATGKKIDGQKAKGKIKFVNKSDKDIKIKKGDEIKLISTDKENLKFKSLDETTVSKATEDLEADPVTKTYGQKEIEVEAIDIGSQYNLKKDQKFELKDYDNDDIVGENQDSFSGGKSEEKTIVAQSDLDDLRKNLEITLKEKVANAVKRKLINSQEIIDQALKYEITNASYNKKLDEEAEEVTLSITMTGVTLAFSKTDLDQVVKESAKTVVPESFVIDLENIKYETAATYDQIAKIVNIQVKLRSSITPNLDKQKIKTDLAGKDLDFAQKYLEGLKNMDEYKIDLVPRLPQFLLKMPLRSENIQVIVNTN